MRKRTAAISEKLRVIAVILIPLVVIPITAGWIGDIGREWISTQRAPDDAWLLGVALLALLAFTWTLFKFGRRYLPARVLRYQENFVPRKAMIAMLSDCTNLGEAGGRFTVSDAKKGPVTLSGDLDTDTDARSALPRWTWQQTLRAARANRPTLERIVLAGSKDASGTPEQTGLCRRFLTAYFPGVHIEATDRTPPFEDIEEIMDMLRHAIRQLNDAGYADRDIIIDCTGGQKPTSIAAALVTLDHPELMFQYMGGADSNAGKVFAFNVASELHVG